MKTCKKCGVEKPESEYYKTNGYLSSMCKACQIQYNAERNKLAMNAEKQTAPESGGYLPSVAMSDVEAWKARNQKRDQIDEKCRYFLASVGLEKPSEVAEIYHKFKGDVRYKTW